MTMIQIRGTSGSGKTTAMRVVLDMLGDWDGVYIPARRKPLYYRNVAPDWSENLDIFVLGHYESPSGGCDNVGSARVVAELVKMLESEARPDRPRVILGEGLLLSEDAKWTPEMIDPVCYFLTTKPDKCLENIKTRREAAGNERDLNEERSGKRAVTIERARVKLLAAGVYCRRCSADQAPRLVVERLRKLAGR